MRASILAAIFPQWRDRDARLCREIVARGICAPTSDLGIAVRATLARVDSLREDRDDAERRWEESVFAPPPQREKDRSRIAELESALAGGRIIIADLRARLDAGGRSDAASALATLAECAWRLGVPRERVLATVCEVRDRATALCGVERDLARVVSERDEARAELAALRDRVKDVAARMAEQVEEVPNG